jgi:hypothetical protein
MEIRQGYLSLETLEVCSFPDRQQATSLQWYIIRRQGFLGSFDETKDGTEPV